MDYKLIILLIGAVLIDIVIGVFMPTVLPTALVIMVFYLALKLEYWQVVPLALIGGFLFDLSLLDGSIFNIIFLVLAAIATKLTSYRLIDFSSTAFQVLSVVCLLTIRFLAFYLIYDRSLNSIFLLRNLSMTAIACAGMVIYLSIWKYYGKEK